MDRHITPYFAHGATLSISDEYVGAAETVCKTLDEDFIFGFLGVAAPPDGEVPVTVGNTVPEWDDTMVYDVTALANTGGGHFIVGYPGGVADGRALAEHIRGVLADVPGLVASAEPLTFCMADAVDVVAERADVPIVYKGQRYTAVRNYGYRSPLRAQGVLQWRRGGDLNSRAIVARTFQARALPGWATSA